MTTHATLPICWKASRIEKAISIKAKLDEKQTDYFMACHSPIRQLLDSKTKQTLDEEQLYQRLLTTRQRDVQAVVYGDAGTGKSHLVHWLKLRADDGLRRGELTDAVIILIERKSGSLKDALEQLIDQLTQSCGAEFEKYLAPVQTAFARISEQTARQKLILAMAVELGPRWRDRGLPDLHKRLRPLAEACQAAGFGRWLCRDGGVIARRIDMLTNASTLSERENRPTFVQSDLLPEPAYCTLRDNSERVIELIQELEDSEKLREEAANVLNTALEFSVIELTGLSGANLRKVFDQIRRELGQRGRRLLLFVEDVSAMAELDSEVVNALEPQDRLDLCPMTAVLGITRLGYDLLRENQVGRFEMTISIGDKGGPAWASSASDLAEFTARYLNALRLSEDGVRSLADRRRQDGGDVSLSECTNCSSRESCHARFGKVALQGVDVGLYPLSPATPHHLLSRLILDEANAIAATPRGFLLFLLKPLISYPTLLEHGNFPDLTQLPVQQTDPAYWTQFQQKYCGGWSEADRHRLRQLAVFWIEHAASAEDAALRLEPLLDALRFRKFSKATKADAAKLKKPEQNTGPSVRVKPPKTTQSDRLDTLRQELRDWLERGIGLKAGLSLREDLLELVRNSLPWDDQTDVPLSEVNSRLRDKGSIEIADQGVSPGFFSIKFSRDEETRELLEALARFRHEGDRTFDFDGGAIHRRTVARWLRRHANEVKQRLQPDVKAETSSPLRTAICANHRAHSRASG